MSKYPILSLVTFLPLLGALVVALLEKQTPEAALRFACAAGALAATAPGAQPSLPHKTTSEQNTLPHIIGELL